MTIRLYDKDVDMLDFSAVVKTCAQRENGYVVTLDQTAFFPEGGGQGADHGTLGGAQVLDAHDVHGEVEHLVSAPLAIGSEVRGHVDAARRLDMMQQHSGEHMFSGLVHGLFGYDNVGFHIGTEAVTMDFNGPLTEEDVRRVELLANQAVWRDQPVEAFVPGREALANIEYRSKKEIDGDVRIVRIEGVDTCACCGTHVHTTGAVGQIKVVGVQKYKSGVRVSILCGRRALAYENAMLDQAKAAIDHGAQFIIMPGIGRQVVEYCIDKKIPVIPNCITPGEMTMAVEYGLDMVKFFPIYQLGGLATLNEYTGAYPMLHFLVTGMLNETNFLPLLENRKVICGGDWMFTQGQALVNNDYALIARNLRESVYQAQDLRNRLAIRK